jgi:hypothetical protein
MRIIFKIVLVVLILPACTLNEIFSQMDGTTAFAPGKGTLVLRTGDTLIGNINWRMKYVENNPAEIKFVPESGPSAIYKASDISEMTINPISFETSDPLPPENYVSLPSLKKGEPVFYNRMINGKLQVFRNRSSVEYTKSVTESTSEFAGIEFTFSKEEGLTIGPYYNVSTRVLESKSRYSSYYISKNNAALVKLDKDNYDSMFNSLFGDCEGVLKELAKNPDLRNFKNFMILAEVYDKLCK